MQLRFFILVCSIALLSYGASANGWGLTNPWDCSRNLFAASTHAAPSLDRGWGGWLTGCAQQACSGMYSALMLSTSVVKLGKNLGLCSAENIATAREHYLTHLDLLDADYSLSSLLDEPVTPSDEMMLLDANLKRNGYVGVCYKESLAETVESPRWCKRMLIGKDEQRSVNPVRHSLNMLDTSLEVLGDGAAVLNALCVPAMTVSGISLPVLVTGTRIGVAVSRLLYGKLTHTTEINDYQALYGRASRAALSIVLF